MLAHKQRLYTHINEVGHDPDLHLVVFQLILTLSNRWRHIALHHGSTVYTRRGMSCDSNDHVTTTNPYLYDFLTV